MLCLTVVEPQITRGRKVIDKLKRTSHHFVKLMLKRNWKIKKKIKGLIVNFY